MITLSPKAIDDAVEAARQATIEEMQSDSQSMQEMHALREENAALLARVAELERDIGAINNEWHAETMRRLKAEAALSSARAMLGAIRECWERHSTLARASFGDDIVNEAANGFNAIGDLLRAHPEPATPAGQRERRLQAQGFEPVTEEQRADNRLVNLGHATPAATVAEPEKEQQT